MKKVLFALDDNHFSEKAFEFARQLNEREPILLTGIYIPAFVNSLTWSISPTGTETLYMPRLIEEDESLVHGNIQSFKEACIKHNIEYRIHGDVAYAILAGIQKETRYADLFVIGFETYYKNSDDDYVHEELKEIIEAAECPVLLVPEDASFPENVVIAFDGSESSVKALKMASYTLPEMSKLPTMIVYADLNENELPDEEYVTELASRHFSNVSFSTLNFDPKKYFMTWLEERPKTLLVTGSYGRSDLSQIFQKSFVSEVLKEHNLPVFISHS